MCFLCQCCGMGTQFRAGTSWRCPGQSCEGSHTPRGPARVLTKPRVPRAGFPRASSQHPGRLAGPSPPRCCYTKRKLFCQNKTLKQSAYCYISRPSRPAPQPGAPYRHSHTFSFTFDKSQGQFRGRQGGMGQVERCVASTTTWNREVSCEGSVLVGPKAGAKGLEGACAVGPTVQ